MGPAAAHALALALQGVAFVLLLAPLRAPGAAALTVLGFALAGTGVAWAWRRYPVPHGLDMCVGMLTLGNLGMLLGWWADAGFAALPAHACCACADALRGEFRPWMWVGMLVGANAAMRWLGRGPAPGREHAVAMYTGGNAGMLAGMLAGGWAAAQLPSPGAVGAFVGMTLGMLAGMMAGTWLAERLGAGVRAVGLWPRGAVRRTS